MREAHLVSKVREAERELMTLVPEGTLMQRAAAGLAAVCLSLLPRMYGSRVVVLAGSGNEVECMNRVLRMQQSRHR